MNPGRYDWLWRKGSREAVVTALANLTDETERGEFYVRAVDITQRWRPSMAKFLSEAYIEEFYLRPEPFGPGIFPSGEVLRVLARIYEQEGAWSLVEWVCEIAVANGVDAGGIEGGFAAWAERVRQKQATLRGD